MGSFHHELMIRLALFWFLVSPLVVLWDVGFILMRPRSLPGGDLHFIWSPYSLYIEIDKPYGDMDNPFVYGQAWLNIVEVFFCFLAVKLLVQQRRSGWLCGFFVSSLTFWKTVLYMIQYTTLCNGSHRLAHLTWNNFLLLFLLPNGVWIVFPFLFILYFGSILLNPPSTSRKPKKS